MYLSVIKVIHDKPTANNIVLKSENFSLRSGARQGCPFSPILFNTILAVLTIVVRQEKYIKDSQIRKKEGKLSLQIM